MGGHSELAKALAHMAKAREKLPTKQERRHQATQDTCPTQRQQARRRRGNRPIDAADLCAPQSSRSDFRPDSLVDGLRDLPVSTENINPPHEVDVWAFSRFEFQLATLSDMAKVVNVDASHLRLTPRGAGAKPIM